MSAKRGDEEPLCIGIYRWRNGFPGLAKRLAAELSARQRLSSSYTRNAQLSILIFDISSLQE